MKFPSLVSTPHTSAHPDLISCTSFRVAALAKVAQETKSNGIQLPGYLPYLPQAALSRTVMQGAFFLQLATCQALLWRASWQSCVLPRRA